jgi:hypothetical protein
MFRTKDGDVYAKCTTMIQKEPPDCSAHLDFALELHKLAEQYAMATGESYSRSVNRVLSQDRTLREAYARYSHHDGSMSIALPVGRPEPNITHVISNLARAYQREHPNTTYPAAVHAVLAADRELAAEYGRFACSRK